MCNWRGIVFGALFTCAVSLALGGLLLRDASRDPGVRFVSGAAVLSLLVFVLCAAGLAYPLVFLAAGRGGDRGMRADGRGVGLVRGRAAGAAVGVGDRVRRFFGGVPE